MTWTIYKLLPFTRRALCGPYRQLLGLFRIFILFRPLALHDHRPFGTSTLLAVYDESGPQLYLVEPSGVSAVSAATSSGLLKLHERPLRMLPVPARCLSLLSKKLVQHLPRCITAYVCSHASTWSSRHRA